MPTSQEALNASGLYTAEAKDSNGYRPSLTLLVIEDGHAIPVSSEAVASRGLGHIVTAGIVIPEQRESVEDDLPSGTPPKPGHRD